MYVIRNPNAQTLLFINFLLTYLPSLSLPPSLYLFSLPHSLPLILSLSPTLFLSISLSLLLISLPHSLSLIFSLTLSHSLSSYLSLPLCLSLSFFVSVWFFFTSPSLSLSLLYHLNYLTFLSPSLLLFYLHHLGCEVSSVSSISGEDKEPRTSATSSSVNCSTLDLTL